MSSVSILDPYPRLIPVFNLYLSATPIMSIDRILWIRHINISYSAVNFIEAYKT